jgi:hypothetical protein
MKFKTSLGDAASPSAPAGALEFSRIHREV